MLLHPCGLVTCASPHPPGKKKDKMRRNRGAHKWRTKVCGTGQPASVPLHFFLVFFFRLAVVRSARLVRATHQGRPWRTFYRGWQACSWRRVARSTTIASSKTPGASVPIRMSPIPRGAYGCSRRRGERIQGFNRIVPAPASSLACLFSWLSRIVSPLLCQDTGRSRRR